MLYVSVFVLGWGGVGPPLGTRVLASPDFLSSHGSPDFPRMQLVPSTIGMGVYLMTPPLQSFVLVKIQHKAKSRSLFGPACYSRVKQKPVALTYMMQIFLPAVRSLYR